MRTTVGVAPVETAAQIAARKAQAREVEADALVASVTRWLPDDRREAQERDAEGATDIVDQGDVAAAVAAWLPANRRAAVERR